MPTPGNCLYEWDATQGKWLLTDTCGGTCPSTSNLTMAPGPGDPRKFTLACGKAFPTTTKTRAGTQALKSKDGKPVLYLDQDDPSVKIDDADRAPPTHTPRRFLDDTAAT